MRSLDVQRRLFVFRELLQRFKTQELIHWKDVLKSFENERKNGSKEDPATGVFGHTDDGKKRWEDFKVRVVEHVGRFLTGDDSILCLERRICESCPNTTRVFARRKWLNYWN